MFNHLKSLTVATLVLSVTVPVLTTSVWADLPRGYSQTVTNPKTETDKLFFEGVQQYRYGQYPQALQTYGRVLELLRQQNDKAGIAQTLNNMGEVYLGLRQDDQADKVLQQALVLRQELKDKAGIGETLDNLGSVYSYKDEYNKALETLQQALAIRRELKDRTGEAKTLSRMGSVYCFDFKKCNKGLELLNQALVIQEQVGDKFQVGITLNRIATVYRKSEDYPHALLSAQKALSLNQEVKNRAGEGTTLGIIGTIYSLQGKYDLALQVLQQALPIMKESGIRLNEHQTLGIISGIYSVQNNIERALEIGQQALAFAKANHLRPQELESLNSLLNYYGVRASRAIEKGLNSQAKADYSRIIELVQEILPLTREFKKREIEAHALAYLGYAYRFFGDYQKAETVSQQAAKIAREIKALDQETTALTVLASIYNHQGKDRQVVEIRLRTIEIYRIQKDQFSEAREFVTLGSNYIVLGEYQKAIEVSQQALAILRKIEIAKLPPLLQEYPLQSEIDALDGLSDAYNHLGQYDKATDFAQQALEKAQTLGKPNLKANALLKLALLYRNIFDNFPKAIELSQQALTIARQIKEPQIEAEALKNLSNVYNEQGNYAQALELANQILAIAKRLENPGLEKDALNSLWHIYYKQGNYQKALSVAQEWLTLVQKSKQFTFEIFALGSLSRSYLALGDTTKAEEQALQALNLAREQKNLPNEDLSLGYLTDVYRTQGKYEQGIQTAQNSLAISRKIQNFLGEVGATLKLSLMYNALGDDNKVIALAEPGLRQARKIGDRPHEAELILNLGGAYRRIGNYPKAKELIEQGLKIAKELKNPRLESIALNSLGYYYTSLNDYQKALSLAQQSLKIAQDLKSPPLTISPQFSLGDIYSELGDYKQSREFYQQALTTAQKLKNRNSEGIALSVQAYTYFAQGEPQKTVELSKQALTIFQEIKVPRLQAFAHRMLSVGYGELGNDAQAIAEAQTFLTFAQKNQNFLWEKSTLNLLGDLHKRFGRTEQAMVAYQQALLITTDSQVTGADAGIYAGLAQIYHALNQPNTAIAYYKQYINKIQEVRLGIQGLPPELQKSFLETTVDFNQVTISNIYRQYANLLLSQGRAQEATNVLELLKTQELKESSTRVNTTSNKPKLNLTASEVKILTPNQQTIALAKQISECEKINCQEKTQLYSKLNKQISEFNQELKKIEQEIRARRSTDYEGFFDPTISAKVEQIVNEKPGTVMIYPLVLEDKVWLLMYSGNTLNTSQKFRVAKKVELNISRDELGKAVKEFRDLMEYCEHAACGDEQTKKVQAASQKLYNWLLKPIDAELKNNQAKNLVFALDRVTRYIPLSALYDGNKYLIENYTIHTVLSASVTDVDDKLPANVQNTSVLAMGTTQGASVFIPGISTPDQFSGLSNVTKELDVIVKNNTNNSGIYPGQKFIDSAFDFHSLQDNLTGKKILHLATHGRFVPELKDASYLLLGTGKPLTIPQIQSLTGLSNIHLVVLSACQTALANRQQDGIEIASLAYYFLNGGAKAVLASLWQVNDPSTKDLMAHFYQNLAHNPQITKAEALRLAQLSLLYGKQVSLDDIKRGAIDVEPVLGKPSKQTSTRANFSHPYYWAPFILIGNGL